MQTPNFEEGEAAGVGDGAVRKSVGSFYRPFIVTFPLSLRVSEILPLFTVRRSALHGLWDRNSVRLSVRLSVTLVDCVHTV